MKINAKIKPEYFSLGFYLMTPLLLGVFIGFELDKRFNTKPTFVVVGIIGGTVGLVYNLWKLVRDINK
jgi:F0F1-type ATP synthase assembly protein I